MIENTKKTARDNPLLTLLQAGGKGGIEAQEAQGQRQLVNSTQLPTKFNSGDRRVLEAAGVVFGDHTEGDDMFCEATLPEGWKKQSTDHSMWSDLLDENGNKRASIFYKAAFYDRDAFINTCRRFGVDAYSHEPDEEICAKVTDAKGEVVFATEPQVITKAQEAAGVGSYNVRREHTKKAEAWLTDNYPDWQDAGAYWE